VKASTRAIRSGLVIKPLKRKYGYTRQQKQQGQPQH
jgi:large subunit ribosomal protein L28